MPAVDANNIWHCLDLAWQKDTFAIWNVICIFVILSLIIGSFFDIPALLPCTAPQPQVGVFNYGEGVQGLHFLWGSMRWQTTYRSSSTQLIIALESRILFCGPPSTCLSSRQPIKMPSSSLVAPHPHCQVGYHHTTNRLYGGPLIHTLISQEERPDIPGQSWNVGPQLDSSIGGCPIVHIRFSESW